MVGFVWKEVVERFESIVGVADDVCVDGDVGVGVVAVAAPAAGDLAVGGVTVSALWSREVLLIVLTVVGDQNVLKKSAITLSLYHQEWQQTTHV